MWDRMVELGIEPPFASLEADKIGSPDEAVTTTIDVWLAHHPGDINQDGVVNISDATAFDELFNNGTSGELLDLNVDAAASRRVSRRQSKATRGNICGTNRVARVSTHPRTQEVRQHAARADPPTRCRAGAQLAPGRVRERQTESRRYERGVGRTNH